MKIGFMNCPGKKLTEEIRYGANRRYDFIDLTFEPPCAIISRAQIPEIKTMLLDAPLEVVGHTAWYLPLDCPFKSVRQAVISEFQSQFETFAELGAAKTTLHSNFSFPHRFFSFNDKMAFWSEAISPLLESAASMNLQVMFENTGNLPEQRRIFIYLMHHFKNLKFHLDVGHANLNAPFNRTAELLKKYGKRLVHVHVSDNFGGADDLHLPLGAGRIPWKSILSELHRIHYDDTFTLEVFSPDRSYLEMSREKLRSWWSEATGSELRNDEKRDN
jgi:sugar phosphate isomerase/epimerase